MSDPEAEFIRELEVFGAEAEAATKFFYTWRTVRDVLSDDENVLGVLDETSSFWHTVLHALLTASLITLGRVFDQDQHHSKHNIDRLLRAAQTDLGIFSKEALAERKRRLSPNADSWLDDYLQRVYVPTDKDFRRLRQYVAARRKTYESKYRPLRHRVFAHKGVSEQADIDALFAKTKNRELQQLIVFLNRLYDALWNLLYNGRKPNLRPARYAVRQIREQPSPLYSHHTVQENTVHETERFLKSLVRETHR
jgi:hypothetical protein